MLILLEYSEYSSPALLMWTEAMWVPTLLILSPFLAHDASCCPFLALADAPNRALAAQLDAADAAAHGQRALS